MAIRITQSALEALVQPTTQRVRVTQTAVEALVAPTSQQVRITQLALEVLVLVSTAPTAQPRFYAQVIG